MAVGLSENELHPFITKMNQERKEFGISIACVNSPRNVTVAGEEYLVDGLKALLGASGVFCRKLRVTVAYHSRQMSPVAAAYESLIGDLTELAVLDLPRDGSEQAPMISSVTGEQISGKRLLNPSYWAENMSAPVQFSRAVSVLIESSAHLVDHMLEIGPAAALQGPIREILNTTSSGPGKNGASYSSVLRRREPAHKTLLQAMGELHCRGVRLNLRRINEPSGTARRRRLLVDLPEYPFDHSQGHWCESRPSRAYRFRSRAVSHFLGVRCGDWTRSEPCWRHFLRPSEMAWTADHVVNGRILFPAAGMLVMALEAVEDLHKDDGETPIDAFALRDVDIEAPIDLADSGGSGTEVRTALRPMMESSQGGTCLYAFTVRSYNERKDEWTLNCRGTISTEVSEQLDVWVRGKSQEHRGHLSNRFFNKASQKRGTAVESGNMYKFLKEHGFEFGPCFQRAQKQLYDEEKRISTAEVEILRPGEQSHVVIHPASLDTMFHLALTALTAGGSQPIATAVPTHLGRLWLSKRALGVTKRPTVRVGVAVDQVTRRGCTCSGVALESTNAPDPETVAWYEDLRMTNVTSNPALESAQKDPKQFCMRVQCKPALKHMEPDDVAITLEKEHPNPPVDDGFWRDIELLCDMAIDELVMSAGAEVPDVQSWKPWRRHYWNWAQHHVAERTRTQRRHGSDTSSLRVDLESRLGRANQTGRLFVTVASNLVQLFHEVTNPLEILMQSGILKAFYEETNDHSTTSQITRYVDLLAHQQPGLKLLEIGGGTGGGTRNFVRGLGSAEDGDSGRLRCARYDFTDVSPTLVGAAKLEFERYQPQMTFGTLDIERSYTEQGFSEEEYDVVLAVNVLHITSNLRQALRRARRSLKTGGKLIFKESLSKQGWVEGFVFGLFPGWWFGVDDGRTLSPSLDLPSWNSLLRETGFSGCEIVLKLLEDTPSPGGWMVATASDETPLPRSLEVPVQFAARIVIDDKSELQNQISKEFANVLQSSCGISAETIPVQAMDAAWSSKQVTSTARQRQIAILLTAYEQPPPGKLEDLAWHRLRTIITSHSDQLWISSGGGRGPVPDHGFLDGLARTLRHEQPDRQVVLLAWDKQDSMEAKLTQAVKVVMEMGSKVPEAQYEQEYIAIDGTLHTRRLVEAADFTASVEEKTAPSQEIPVPCDGKTRFKISHESSEARHILHYEQTAPASKPLQTGEVEVLVKALALGTGKDEGGHCAGSVVRTSSDTGYHVGDRVFATFPGQIFSHLVVSARLTVRIPEDMSFSDSCFVIPPKITAFHASVEVGRAQSDSRVLVHNGASPAGQSLLEALVARGSTDIWATAANLDQSQEIESLFKLPPDRIVPSAWLEGESMLLSRWRSYFNVILMEGTPKTACLDMGIVRPGGRIVVLRSCRDTSESTLTPSSRELPPNTSLSVVDADGIIPSRAALDHAAGKGPTAAGHGAVCGRALPASAVAEVRGDEPVVVTFEASMTVNVRRLDDTHAGNDDLGAQLDPGATYVISGGLGGLGRATARWLAKHGARYLILLSRSGPRGEKALELLSELEKMGVYVEAQSCDISNEASLRSALADCSERVPPIKGCIQASMVLKVRGIMRSRNTERLTFFSFFSGVLPR